MRFSFTFHNWKIIFTTRYSYLDDLKYQFVEVFNLSFRFLTVENLTKKELAELSRAHQFILPSNDRLRELLHNPFYLNEYLKFYKKDNGDLDYVGFKDKLWNKNIKKNKPVRSECFLKVAIERVNQGSFFVDPSCESSILNDELVKDGILGYEENNGYFITHDIYEEWALEKIINREYYQKTNNQIFFKNLGQSLPIRRSFRNWVSEKLLLQDREIGHFIEAVIVGEEIQSFWKDEILISVLLSDYSEIFFKNFKNTLLDNGQGLLKKTMMHQKETMLHISIILNKM